MNGLAGRVAVVTGASRSLGAAIARRLFGAGADLLLVARDGAALDRVCAGLGAPPGQRANRLVADLSETDAPERIADHVHATFGGLDILVNNAAIQGPIGPLTRVDWCEWERTLRVDLIAPVALARLLVPMMPLARPARGKIINVSGGGATGPRPNFSAYAAAKAGLVRFTETLAGELAPGIDVNAVAPGAIHSAMTRATLDAGRASAGDSEYEAALRTAATTGDVVARAAELCAFLASPASDGITGRLISAVWDCWEDFPSHVQDLCGSDVYTLRRIVPRDRGFTWGER
jgi:3-oxoacyl-[acyl-carrier protein] reductase